MNNILELSNQIDKELTSGGNINNKIKMINELNILIEKQKEYYNEMILQINSSQSIKIESKYKKKSIEELEELFNDPTINIEEKINIYNAINKYYNDKLIKFNLN